MAIIELGIANVFLEGGRTCVEGRCHESEIRLGDTFSELFGPTYSLDWFTEKWLPSTAHTTRPVNLRVDYIEAYQQPLKALWPAYGGFLIVSGTGVALLLDLDLTKNSYTLVGENDA